MYHIQISLTTPFYPSQLTGHNVTKTFYFQATKNILLRQEF